MFNNKGYKIRDTDLVAAASFGYNLGYMIEGACDCNIQYNPITKDFTPIEQTYMQYDRLGIDLFKK